MLNGSRGWSMVIGILLILIACVVGFFSTKPAEADVSIINQFATPYVAMRA